MVTNQAILSDLPVPPGEYLEEVIEELGMTKEELARCMNRPASKLSAIFKGDKVITPDTALQLEKVVGVPAHIWTGMESDYRLAIARHQQSEDRNRLKEEISLITKFRCAELVKRGVVPKMTRGEDKVFELQKFFGVTSLKTVLSLKRYQAAFRMGKLSEKKQSPEAISAWLRIGELQARKQLCDPFNKQKIKAALPIIRQMTPQPLDQLQNQLSRILSSAGVALVICPHLTGTGLHGATFRLGKDKAVVMMSLRYKWSDIFWFSLFHELGHVLFHGRQDIILEGMADIDDPALKKQEDEANRFAADTLVPPKAYRSFVKDNRFYEDDIISFADQVAISPGIIVGRLQNDGLLEKSWQNGLRTQFEWKRR